jgi:MFS family permease
MTRTLSTREFKLSKPSKFDLKPWVVGFVCILIAGISYGFGMYLLPMILPEITKDLHLDYTQIGTITGIGQASVFFSIPLAGFLTNRIGGLKLIVGIQFIGAILLAGLYMVDGFKSFLILHFLIRAWPVMTWIPLVSVAMDHIPMKWRAAMFTLASSSGCFFLLIDGILSSFFLKHLHWRTLWLAVALICLVSSLVSYMALKFVGVWHGKNPSQVIKDKSDYVGFWEWVRSSNGMILNLIFLNLIFLIIGLTFATFQVYLAPYLRDELGVGLDTTALMWATMGISGALGGAFFGLITDHLGVRISKSLIFLSGLGSACFLFFPESPYSLIFMALLFGISQATIYGMGPAYISKVMPAGSAARVFTFGTMVMSLGALTGNFLGGWSKGVTDTFYWFYLAMGALFALGALLSLLLVSEKKYFTGSSI